MGCLLFGVARGLGRSLWWAFKMDVLVQGTEDIPVRVLHLEAGYLNS
jgi:hypothetical protein